jgi:dihydroflavonol-4-reductase
MDTVLVTGISGFLGGHVALELLRHGHAVLGSVRSADKASATRQALAAQGADLSRLEFCHLDLLDDRGWSEAAGRCRYTVHVASPFVTTMPRDPDELIRPAVDGTERALRAALGAGHERIVLTSSLAAIDGGHRDHSKTLTEADWTDVDGPLVTAYVASKTLAERRAWDLVEAMQARGRLVVINPGTILGPLIDQDPGTSGEIVLRMLRGAMPMAPDVILEYVDVRDVAAAHVAALMTPAAAGHRHILAAGGLSLMEVANILRAAFPGHAAKLPRRAMPPWLATLVSLWDAGLRDSRPFLGIRRPIDRARGASILRRPLMPASQAVTACGQSLIARGLVA